MLPAVDRLGVARAGSGGDHGVGRPAGRIGLAGEGGAGDESAAGSGQDVDVPAEPSGQDALRGVPSAGSAAEEQPDGIGGEASEPTGEGDGEVLVWRRGRGGAAIAGRPAQRRQAPGRVLAAPATGGHGADPLPPRRLTTSCVVRPTQLPCFSLVDAACRAAPTPPRCRSASGTYYNRARRGGIRPTADTPSARPVSSPGRASAQMARAR